MNDRSFSAIAELRRQLTLPHLAKGEIQTSDEFDPWEIFPCFYGSYDSDFDDMAILVLDNILNKRWGQQNGEGLAHQMFREVLCTSNLCDYGSSPRGCFPNWGSGFEDLLPQLIERWREYRLIRWGDDIDEA